MISLVMLLNMISASMIIFDEANEAELKSSSIKVPSTEEVAEIFGDSSLVSKIDELESEVAESAEQKDILHARVKELRGDRLGVEDKLYAKVVPLRGSDLRYRYIFPRMSELRQLEDRLDAIDRILGFLKM